MTDASVSHTVLDERDTDGQPAAAPGGSQVVTVIDDLDLEPQEFMGPDSDEPVE